MDDLDSARNKPGSADQILQELGWLGLDFDGEVIFQSKRHSLYSEVFHQLHEDGRVFPCSCSRKDIAEALSAPDRRDPALRYPGTCRPTDSTNIRDLKYASAWRFQVTDKPIVFRDCVFGVQQVNLAISPGDFVVRRKDGIFAYQLASVVDDALLGVSDVVRGDDLLDSTGRQIALFDALNYSAPNFWHVALMNDQDGNKMSKRDGSGSIAALRATGVTPQSVIGKLAQSVGLNTSGEPLSTAELLAGLTLQNFTRLLRSIQDIPD